MDWPVAFCFIFIPLLVLMFLGFPVAFSMLAAATFNAFFWWNGIAGLNQLTISLFESIHSFIFLPIPLFALMGELLFHSKVATRILDTMDKWLGRIPGRLSLLAVLAGAVMSTLTGAGTATIAVLGAELVPEMEKRGYNKSMSLGPIIGSSGLAIMIPPSGLAVLIASMGQISVSQVLIAIIVPGILMAVLYATYIIAKAIITPSAAPTYKVEHQVLLPILIETVIYVLPVGLVVFMVTGVIFLGIATPSESAATGVLGVLILIAMYRKLTWNVIKKALLGTIRISGMIFLIIAAATTFGQLMAFSGVTNGIINLVVALPLEPFYIICLMIGCLLIMGMFIPVIPMILIALPVMVPLVVSFGFSPVWFATLLMLTLEMAAASPPYGTELFVMKQVAPADTTIKDVYKAAIPFIICDFIAMILLLFIPGLALWLPSLML